MTRNKYSGSKLLAIVAVVFCSTAIAGAADDDAALDKVRAKMSDMFESIDPENISVSPVDGWFTIQQGSIIAYVSDDGRYLLQGDLIDLEQQVNLSEQSRNNARRDLIATLKDEDAILFSPADVKYSVTVFTDVDCTYCRKMHSQINGYLDNGIQVRYALYPRRSPGPRQKKCGVRRIVTRRSQKRSWIVNLNHHSVIQRWSVTTIASVAISV